MARLHNKLPELPRLVLRVGFAGSKNLSAAAKTTLPAELKLVFQTLGHRLAAIARGVPVEAGQEPRVAAWYQPRCPLLRLITGLCEGADCVAAQALEQVEILPDQTGPEKAACLETELAAVLPFDVLTYRRTRPPDFHNEFNRQAALCSYILVSDGRYDKPPQETTLSKNRRARAYRAQSALLLRQCDLLVAALNPDDAGKAGGTLETVRAALNFGLSVVLVNSDQAEIRLLEPGVDLDSVLMEEVPKPEEWQERLTTLVGRIVADPDLFPEKSTTGHDADVDQGDQFLREYFTMAASPPLMPGMDGAHKHKADWRAQFWSRLETGLRSGPAPKNDPILASYEPWRTRATMLNYHYAGLYRGSFVLNNLLAVAAVTLAALGLVRLAWVPGAASRGWLLPLAVAELVIVFFISHNIGRAKREQWNDLAVDYRYLAERLRTLYYLPYVGSFRPPNATAQRYASRALRQSAVDWLFGAIARSVPPAARATEETLRPPETGRELRVRILSLDPLTAITTVRNSWIAEQVKYHARNARTMELMNGLAEGATSRLSKAVIFLIALDLLKMLWPLPEEIHEYLLPVTLCLIFLAAVLPAAVAGFNALRFQSECHRLAERSAMFRIVLGGRPPLSSTTGPRGAAHFWKHPLVIIRLLLKCPQKIVDPPLSDECERKDRGRWHEAGEVAKKIAAARSKPETDPAAWSQDALRFTETIAHDFVQEVAEWSVLYAKELTEV